ncbi:MAG: aspartate aminotransferase family protein [Halanaeroarchaeum sp.]
MSGFVFSEKPIEIVSGDGATLTDANGTEYLDVGASYAVASVGHSHPEVVAAIQEQAEELAFVQGSYPVGVREALRESLAAIAPGNLDDVWLANSGTEANEAALKFARHATGRSKIVAAKRGFHGRTMGSLAATWKQQYRAGFEPLAGDVEFVPYDDPEALAGAVDEETAAVILEPIQGEGGIRPASHATLERARELTEEAGAALIFDEIQTGLGRTGSTWACERAGVVPDAITTAKGLGSGLPVGATIVADWIAEDPGDHGSTFSGSPIVAAAAGATLSVIESEDLVANAGRVGAHLHSRLEALEAPRDVRGEGLLLGVEVKRGANRILRDLALEHQVLALPAGRTVVRLLPPLILSESQADRAADALAEVLS